MHVNKNAQVYNTALRTCVFVERPLHSSDTPHSVVRAWWDWPEVYRKQACLCLKPTCDLMLKLSNMVRLDANKL